MTKAAFSFDLPEETTEYLMYHNAPKMAAVLWDFDTWLRNEIKYNERNELQEVRDTLRKICNEDGFNIDELE